MLLLDGAVITIHEERRGEFVATVIMGPGISKKARAQTPALAVGFAVLKMAGYTEARLLKELEGGEAKRG
jgi:hypothetical protein